jgi:hypothetical protein
MNAARQAESSSHSHIEFHHEDRSPLGSPDAIFESRLYLDVDPEGIRATIDLVTWSTKSIEPELCRLEESDIPLQAAANLKTPSRHRLPGRSWPFCSSFCWSEKPLRIHVFCSVDNIPFA